MPEDIERWDPFREVMTLRNRVDHLFESMFARPRGAWMTTIVDYPTLDMYVMNADGFNPTRLTTNPADDTNPVWSPTMN